MRKIFQDLIAEVAQHQTVNTSAAALIDGLQAQLEQAETDVTLLPGIIADMKAQREALAAAMAANTPANSDSVAEAVDQASIDAALDPDAITEASVADVGSTGSD